MVLLHLVVRKFEDLKAVWEGRLSGLCLIEEVDNPLVWVGLLHVSVFEVHNCVSVQESLSPYSIGKDHLFLPIEVQPLHLAVRSFDFALYGDIGVVVIMIFVGIGDIEIFRIKSALWRALDLLDSNSEARLLIAAPLTLGGAFFSDLFFNTPEL